MTSNAPIRVLHVIGKMNRGGAETLIMNLYRNIDRRNIQFDFLVHTHEEGDYDGEIKRLGGRIYVLPLPNEVGVKVYKKGLSKVLESNGPFKAVHSHVHYFSGIILSVSKKLKVPIRIAHSHTTSDGKNSTIRRVLYRKYMSFLINKNSTNLFSCSDKASSSLFGSRSLVDKRLKRISNGVDLNLFENNKDRKREILDTLNIDENDTIIGHVGSFTYPKNHKLMIEIFALLKIHIANAKLVLVGDGPLKETILQDIKAKGLEKSVFMLGVREDVPDIMSIFDVFLFPSIYEGLPTVLIEAQASSLRCIISDNITKEIDMGLGLINSVGINENKTVWIEAILNALKYKNKQLDWSQIQKNIKKGGFDIQQVSSCVERLYTNDEG
jgi:glycosyltransferase involved in cell wall biosynthesis